MWVDGIFKGLDAEMRTIFTHSTSADRCEKFYLLQSVNISSEAYQPPARLSFRSDECDMVLYKIVTQQPMAWQTVGKRQRG
jgi:hypothetical protein